MSSSSFPNDPKIALVADASVVINLNATERAGEIVRAVPNPVLVTENAHSELKNGVPKGYDDAEALQTLIKEGIVGVTELNGDGVQIYESLIEGSAAVTLDDGEAATIGHAHEIGGAALIDERKARRLCGASYPSLPLVSTIDLLTHKAVVAQLGEAEHIEAIVRALQRARMRVPPERLSDVVSLIGQERAAACPSLPRSARCAT